MEIKSLAFFLKWKWKVDRSFSIGSSKSRSVNRIHLAQINFKVWVIYGHCIIDVPVREIPPKN